MSLTLLYDIDTVIDAEKKPGKRLQLPVMPCYERWTFFLVGTVSLEDTLVVLVPLSSSFPTTFTLSEPHWSSSCSAPSQRRHLELEARH